MNRKLLATLLTSLTLTLTACGGSNTTSSNFGAISTLEQQRAGTSIEAARIDSFVNALLIELANLESQGTGVTNLTCTTGTASSNFIDTDNDGIFNNTNTITVTANSCFNNVGITLDGEYVYQSTNAAGTKFTITYNGYSIDGETLSGNLTITQNNYNIVNGTGSLTIAIPNTLTLGSQTISNATYVFNLTSTTTYNLTANFTVSNPSSGTLTAVTGTAFAGTYSYSAQNGASVNNPTIGFMTITASDNSTITVDANTGNPLTLRIGASGVTQEFNWD